MSSRAPATAQAVRQFPAMTAIRGIAAWWVVLFHIADDASPLMSHRMWSFSKDGTLAVDLFFELSGFVIALNYAHLFRGLTPQECLRFWGVRLARIYPLHLFMLTLFLINPIAIGLFAHDPYFGTRYHPDYWLLSVVLMQNWGFVAPIAWNPPAWSISTEWAAYLAFPVLVWLSSGLLRTSLRAVAGAVLLMTALAVATATTTGNLGADIPHFGLTRCLLEFGTGMCLFYLWRAMGDATRWGGELMALAAFGLMAAYAVFSLPDYIVFPAAFFLLILSLTNERTLLARCLSVRPLLWLGTISYSTYMVHYFVKDWVKFLLFQKYIPLGVSVAAYFLLTLAASAVLYRWIELPGRKALRGWTLGRRPRALATHRVAWLPAAQRDMEPPR